LNVSPEAERDVGAILKSKNVRENDHLAVVHPGGNWNLKRWPPQSFSTLIGRLTKDLGVKVVVSGGAKDTALAKAISSALEPKPVLLTGKTNLKQLIALMKRAQCVISADSGPLHLANSVGTAVAGIYGPTRPEITGPRGGGRAHVLQRDVGCNREACYFLECPDNVCMQSVTVEEVFERVKQIRDQ